MAYQKFNRDKAANIKMGQFFDNSTLLQESAALTREENKEIEINMLRESIINANRADSVPVSVAKRQKYLNESY
jgi:hypothetical protein